MATLNHSIGFWLINWLARIDNRDNTCLCLHMLLLVAQQIPPLLGSHLLVVLQLGGFGCPVWVFEVLTGSPVATLDWMGTNLYVDRRVLLLRKVALLLGQWWRVKASYCTVWFLGLLALLALGDRDSLGVLLLAVCFSLESCIPRATSHDEH
ncbi:hypothetical protein OUZ56_024387 [Daphnia magna]|uniref:Uncharacterized protein n=1 Tax=Daphnia magna TaxID=35525 RepID=A0ABR0B0Q6_9CRUS|nr:hypothetical protein OUZ56_024387 [Daphnia magna]